MLALPIALFAAAAVVAFSLAAHRDFGLGMLPVGTGPPAARRSLLSPLGLAWRLQRGVLLGWGIGMFFGGALFGSLGQQVADLSNNPQFVQMMDRLGGAGASLTDTFFAAAMALLAAISAGYPLQALLRMHSEESDGRLEPVLAAAVGRTRWVAGHLTLAVLGTVGLLLLAGAGAGLADSLVTGERTTRILTLTLAAVVQASAPLILAGFVVAAFGLLPRWTEALSWTALTLSLLLGPLGEILNLPAGARDLSPFSHTPAFPAGEITASLTLAPLAVAAALTAIGLAGFHRRNLALPA